MMKRARWIAARVAESIFVVAVTIFLPVILFTHTMAVMTGWPTFLA